MASYSHKFLFARDTLSNITDHVGLKHGFLSANHTSNLTAGWTPGTLPSPFPLVIVSSFVSLILAFIGWKTAISTWISDEQRRQVVPVKRPEGFENWSWGQRWSWARRNPYGAQFAVPIGAAEEAAGHDYIALHCPDDIVPATECSTGTDRVVQVRPPQKANDPLSHEQDAPPMYTPEYRTAREPTLQWYDSLGTKITVLVSVVYNTLRAVFAVVTTLQIAATHKGTHAANSSLLLLYFSLQTFISNRKIPRVISFLLVLDLILVGIALLVSTWDFNSHSYGDAIIMGGNCPQTPAYASDCRTQVHQWSVVGCGTIVGPRNMPNTGSSTRHPSPNPNYADSFYPPYTTAGDINAGNKLETIEAVIGALGTFWVAFTLLMTIYEAIRTFFTAESMAHLLWPIPYDDKYTTSQKTGRTRRRIGWGAMSLFAFFALGGAIFVTIMSIAAHIVGETHTHTATYIDSFGPPIHLNFTETYWDVNHTPQKNLTSPYGGNATSWTDCFTITLPNSRNGFFSDWLEHNSEVVFRLISLL
jgi:hypothetical protein